MCRKNESAVINLVIRNAVDYNFLSEILGVAILLNTPFFIPVTLES